MSAHSEDCGPSHNNSKIDAEREDWYVEGGYHPVSLGDKLGDKDLDAERYIIIHKLGFGPEYTVWLARDTK